MKIENPVKLDDSVTTKLEQAAAIDATWEECAFYANISVSCLYNWLESVEGLRERLEALRNKPVLKARQTIINSLEVPKDAQWYLERKRKKEFGSSLDLTSGNEKLNIQLVTFSKKEKNEGDDTP